MAKKSKEQLKKPGIDELLEDQDGNNLDDMLEGEESIFDLAEKEMRDMLAGSDMSVKLRAVAMAPRFEQMRPQKKRVILSEEMRFLIELLLHIEERFEISAMDALKTLRRSTQDLGPILGKRAPRHK